MTDESDYCDYTDVLEQGDRVQSFYCVILKSQHEGQPHTGYWVDDYVEPAPTPHDGLDALGRLTGADGF